MSWLDFLSRVIDSVAWPLVVLIATIVLRRPIVRLLTDRPPKRVKAGPLEVEWTREIAEVETELSAAGTTTPPEMSADEPSLLRELEAVARTVPPAAVIQAYALLERELYLLLEAKGQRADLLTRPIGAVGLARQAAKHGIIPTETARAVQGVSVLRNLAAHGSAPDISTEQALDYLALVDAVLFTLRK